MEPLKNAGVLTNERFNAFVRGVSSGPLEEGLRRLHIIDTFQFPITLSVRFLLQC